MKKPPAANLIGLAGACRILGIVDTRQLEALTNSPLIRPAIVEIDGVRWFDIDVLHEIRDGVRRLHALQLRRNEGLGRRDRATQTRRPGAGPAVAARPAAASPPERPADRPVKPDYRPPVVYSPGRNARPQATGTAPHRAAVPPLMAPPRGVLAPQPVRAPVEEVASPPPTTATAFDEWCNAPLPDLADEDEDEGDAS